MHHGVAAVAGRAEEPEAALDPLSSGPLPDHGGVRRHRRQPVGRVGGGHQSAPSSSAPADSERRLLASPYRRAERAAAVARPLALPGLRAAGGDRAIGMGQLALQIPRLARCPGCVMTMPGPYLVLGATGNQGGSVARSLLKTGAKVRAFTRNPSSATAQALAAQGVQVVPGDMEDIGSLVTAAQGASGIFSVQNFWDCGLENEVRWGKNVLTAAQDVGGPHVIYSSGWGAQQPEGVPAIAGKAELETALRSSGLPYTILRPGLFMDDFLGASLPFSPGLQRLLRSHRRWVGRMFLQVIRSVMPPTQPLPLLALEDVGHTAAAIWTTPEPYLGKTLALAGSNDPTEEVLRVWTERTGQAVHRLPGMSWGLQIGHPQMAALLHWLSMHEDAVSTNLPVSLSPFSQWLGKYSDHPL